MKTKLHSLFIVLALVLLFLTRHAAFGNTLTVTSFADNLGNPFTLRTAVNAANDGDTIIFSDALRGFTITLLNGEILVNKNLTITGPSDASISIVGGNVNNSFNKRIFHVTAPPQNPPNQIRTFWVSGLQMQGSIIATNGLNGTPASPAGGGGANPGGNVMDSGGGGAIYCEDSTLLVVSNCYFASCLAKGGNGGDAYSADCSPPSAGGMGGSAGGGAIFCFGDCFLYDCSFYTNTAVGGAGGAGAQGGAGGNGGTGFGGALAVGYHSGTDLQIINCTFYGNVAYGGNGGAGGAGYFCPTEALPADGGAGGVGGAANGGAVFVHEDNVPPTGMIHSTIHRNYCSPGGGGAGGAGVFGGQNGATGDAGNANGCGLDATGVALPAGNTLFAGNRAQPANALTFGPDVNAVLQSLGHNLVAAADASCVGLNGSDLQGTVPQPLHVLLGPFLNNGGDLPTLAPQEGSPAIDAGTTGGVPFDEIGQMRPVVAAGIVNGGDGSDIGAFEVQCGSVIPNPNIVTGGNSLFVTWPAPSFCFKLQTSPDLVNWSDYLGPVNVVGTMNQAVFNALAAKSLFFRLVKL